MNAAELCAAPHSEPRAPGFSTPSRACDCHVHVFGPHRDFPLVAERMYTPPPALLSDYHRMRGVLGLQRAVIVQPSVYGTANRATLEAAAAGGEDFRAVVVVDSDTPKSVLHTMHDAGARGVRINPMFSRNADLSDLKRLAHSLADMGWHLQVLVDVSQLEGLETLAEALPVALVFDHMGHVPTEKGIHDAGFQSLLRLLGQGRCWVKLSGAYRVTAHDHPPYDDVTPFAKALLQTNPEQLVWGSDWPHPRIPVPMPNDGDLMDLLDTWVPDVETRDRILVDNPARLYDFEATG